VFLDCLIQWRVALERTQLQIILVDADLQQLAFGLEDGEAARPKLRQPGNDGVGAGGGRMALGGAHGDTTALLDNVENTRCASKGALGHAGQTNALKILEVVGPPGPTTQSCANGDFPLQCE